MSDDGVIKTLRNVAILVTVIVSILMVAHYNPESYKVFAWLLGIAIFVSLPFYVLLISAKRGLKNDKRAGIRTAYLRACVVGLGATFLVVAFAVYIVALSLGPCASALIVDGLPFVSPPISGVVMFAVFRLVLLLRRVANKRDADGSPRN